ncbi:MAG: DUF4910 domain-containing protein [Anaerolineales bacterium]|nr:DUF4910 domain-containing protein [Anaerolineales bacterium]
MTDVFQLIEKLWYLRRDIISDGYDQALSRLAEEVPMVIHRIPSGTECWTWIVPEKWTVHEARLETLDGEVLIDTANHPLHVVSYSLPFEGVVCREELFQHLHVHKTDPHAIPYVFKYYDRDWGLCCSRELRDSLQDKNYRVVIRTTFEPGELKVGEVFVQGESEQTVVVAAHLCHPAQVNDDLTGTLVAIKLFQELLQKKDLYYSYRLLILPETIGSIAYLSQNEDQIPSMIGGLFLEMLGSDSGFALQQSLLTDSRFDRCITSAFGGAAPEGYTAGYRSVICNDERQFNSPGVRIPMLSLSRVEPPGSPTRPYPEYHSSMDNPSIVSFERLEQSLDLVRSLLQVWENDRYAVNHYKGEVFCSRYGIWPDYRTNPEGHRSFFAIMERIDGGRTLSDIAIELGIPYQAVESITEMLAEKNLVSYSRTAQSSDPHTG